MSKRIDKAYEKMLKALESPNDQFDDFGDNDKNDIDKNFETPSPQAEGKDWADWNNEKEKDTAHEDDDDIGGFDDDDATPKELMDAVMDDSEITGRMYNDESFKDSDLKNINEIFSESKDYEAVLDFNAKRELGSGGDRADDVSGTTDDTKNEDKRVGMINEPNKELGSHKASFSQEYARLSKELEFDEDGNYVNPMRKEREDEEANEDADLYGGGQIEGTTDLYQAPKPEEISPLDENTVHAHEDDRSGGATATSLDAEDETAQVLNDDGFVEKRSGDLETQATEIRSGDMEEWWNNADLNMRADVLVLAGVDTSWANGEFSDLDGGVAWRLRDFISDAGTGGVDHDAQKTWSNPSGGQISPKSYFWADDEKYGKDQIHGGVMGDYESKATEGSDDVQMFKSYIQSGIDANYEAYPDTREMNATQLYDDILINDHEGGPFAQTVTREEAILAIAETPLFQSRSSYNPDTMGASFMNEAKATELDEFGGGQGETYSSHHRAYYEKFSGKSWGEMTTADLDAVDDKMNAGQIPQYDGDGEDDSYYQSHETQKKTKI